MKLLFPNGEHGPVELKDGTTRVGSGAGAEVDAGRARASRRSTARSRSRAAARSCASPRPATSSSSTASRSRRSADQGRRPAADREGRRARRVARGAPPRPRRRRKPEPAAVEDDGKTRVRMALPRFVLRGVSGSTFGKTFPLLGTMTIGRAADCDISIPAEEISRHHAKLQVMPDGVAVEDLGSANGTFINGKRVHQGMLKARRGTAPRHRALPARRTGHGSDHRRRSPSRPPAPAPVEKKSSAASGSSSACSSPPRSPAPSGTSATFRGRWFGHGPFLGRPNSASPA